VTHQSPSAPVRELADLVSPARDYAPASEQVVKSLVGETLPFSGRGARHLKRMVVPDDRAQGPRAPSASGGVRPRCHGAATSGTGTSGSAPS
jgi:hypothetical protein